MGGHPGGRKSSGADGGSLAWNRTGSSAARGGGKVAQDLPLSSDWSWFLLSRTGWRERDEGPYVLDFLVWPKTPESSLGVWDSPRQTKPSKPERGAAQALAAGRPTWWVGFSALLGLRPAQEARPWGEKTGGAPVKHTRSGMRPGPNPGQGHNRGAQRALSAALGILLSMRVTISPVYCNPLPSQSSTINKILF